jgi:hypothetical protein
VHAISLAGYIVLYIYIFFYLTIVHGNGYGPENGAHFAVWFWLTHATGYTTGPMKAKDLWRRLAKTTRVVDGHKLSMG